jgi:hypothetical protein
MGKVEEEMFILIQIKLQKKPLELKRGHPTSVVEP